MHTHGPSRCGALAAALVAALAAPGLLAQDPAAAQPTPSNPTADIASALPWRELGPANMGGRVTDIAVHDAHPSTWYVATAGGGLWKTRNGGTTWDVLFDDQSSVSIGDVAIAPSNPDVIWVGTGEENARNSVSFGDGVYRSDDGGKTFTHAGLRETFQIGHIEIHPADPQVVFVAALGRLWGHNPDRGVFRTRDGGQTWQKVLYLDEKTGCIDVRIDPKNPSIVHACMYERMRDGFDSNDPAVRFGQKAGYFRSTDGGDTWSRIDAGLPTVPWGRSGLTVHRDDPSILFMTVETERSGWATGDERTRPNAAPQGGNAYMGIQGEDSADPAGAKLTTITQGGPSADAGLEAGDVIQKVGETEITNYRALLDQVRMASGGEKATLTYVRAGKAATTEITWGTRRGAGGGGGGGGGAPFAGRLGGQRQNVQGQQGENGFQTGGVFRSGDAGLTWERVNSLTDRPFYYSVIAVDPRNAEHVYATGVPFFASFDGGKKFDEVQRNVHVDFHAIWVDPTDSDHLLLAGDGGVYETFDRTENWRHVSNLSIGQFYHAQADNADPYRVHGGLQDNGTWSGPSRTRWREGIATSEWVTTFGGDGFRAIVDPQDPDTYYATSQNGGLGRVNLRTGRTYRVNKPDDAGSWNWDTPFFVSPHNSRILYVAGRRAAVSLDRGNRSQSISPELGLTERGTATAFAESPRVPGVLYVGTDDGALWHSADGGRNWTEIHDKVIGLPGPRYVSSIEASHHADGRVYVTFDGHRSDDNETYVFVSEDHGDNWRALTDALPEHSPAHVVREDPRRSEVLYVGTEFGCHVSTDRGKTWHELSSGLPTVAVRDLHLQDRDGDLVAATHGRGIWVLDIAPLRQLAADDAEAGAILFRPERATLWVSRSKVTLGHDTWRASNPPSGAPIHLWLAEAPGKSTKVTVHDASGAMIGSMPVGDRAGLHVLEWNLRQGGGRRGGSPVAPGTYSVRFEHGDEKLVQPLTVRADPAGAHTPLSTPFTQTPSRN